MADAVAGIQILGRGLVDQAAAFQQADAQAAAQQPVGDGDAGGTGADNAQIGIEMIGDFTVCIDEHRFSLAQANRNISSYTGEVRDEILLIVSISDTFSRLDSKRDARPAHGSA